MIDEGFIKWIELFLLGRYTFLYHLYWVIYYYYILLSEIWTRKLNKTSDHIPLWCFKRKKYHQCPWEKVLLGRTHRSGTLLFIKNISKYENTSDTSHWTSKYSFLNYKRFSRFWNFPLILNLLKLLMTFFFFTFSLPFVNYLLFRKYFQILPIMFQIFHRRIVIVIVIVKVGPPQIKIWNKSLQ